MKPLIDAMSYCCFKLINLLLHFIWYFIIEIKLSFFFLFLILAAEIAPMPAYE